ncbi:PadR family transcriptional regulator [Sphingomonas sp. Leaf38]|uniref:PadR family transcriptional regulator n=1 Tax=Sphingomonas sp. Leaf38 TaxID=1736217 RepID=UPI0006F672E9|nr:PadR family transcriptional regulator [Sphingomonas sp. Leaf38]
MRFGMGYGAWTGGPRAGDHGHGHGPRDHGDEHMTWKRGGGPRGRGRRLFDGGEMKLVLLKLIADSPRHGYDLIREVEGRSGGAYAPSPGVVYPTLSTLDDMGLIEEQKSEGAKKRFAVTAEGQAILTENMAVVDGLFARLAAVGAESERTDGAPIRRAMGNLRQVLQHRLMREDVNEDTLHEVAALLDEAAQKIERLK